MLEKWSESHRPLLLPQVPDKIINYFGRTVVVVEVFYWVSLSLEMLEQTSADVFYFLSQVVHCSGAFEKKSFKASFHPGSPPQSSFHL